jgi:predicted RNase H-like nuclease (RuvC/YqgF family)
MVKKVVGQKTNGIFLHKTLMADNKARILGLKSEIARIKVYIDGKKNSIKAQKASKIRVTDRYKNLIKSADSKGKEKLREKKKREIENYDKQIAVLNKAIEDQKKQINRLKEQISKL